jgi:predicted nucleotide-binding protein (sugar kinase/HSP70/actin superfamily)
MKAYLSEYKGKKILSFKEKEEDKFPRLSIGITKAKLILDNLPAIQAFVKQYGIEAEKKAETSDEFRFQ